MLARIFRNVPLGGGLSFDRRIPCLHSQPDLDLFHLGFCRNLPGGKIDQGENLRISTGIRRRNPDSRTLKDKAWKQTSLCIDANPIISNLF